MCSPESRRTPAPPLPSIQPSMFNGQQYNLPPTSAAQVAALIPFPAPPPQCSQCTQAVAHQ